MISSSKYINKSRRDYSLYVLQMRAIPAIADGLKAGARRILWTARDGSLFKSATLSGRTMPLHPHAQPDGAINTLAAPYGNNIPLLHGDGSFGTLLKPTAYGATRYTSVKLSQFTKDVVFRDIELIPMVENYDGTQEEPRHFLPLVPVVLLNPTQGIAIGFATNILPRALEDIIETQILFLKGRKRITHDLIPHYSPTNSTAVEYEETPSGNWAYYFNGEYKKINSTTVLVSSLPYGVLHENFIEHLEQLKENDVILEYEDRSSDAYNIEIKFKRGKMDDPLTQLKLCSREIENLTVLDFNGTAVLTPNPIELIRLFTDWRLGWYLLRYQRLHDELQIQTQKYLDILLAINNNIGSHARKIQSRGDLINHLKSIGIIHTDYISALPIYRFTKEEKAKVEQKIKEAKQVLLQYKMLIKNKDERKKIYIQELREVLKQHEKGIYIADN